MQVPLGTPPRYHRSSNMRTSFPLEILVELYPEGSEGQGQNLVGADREHQIHQLLVVELGGQGLPCRIGDLTGPDQLVDRPQHGPLEGGPSGGIGAGRDPLDFDIVQSDVRGQDAVLLPLVGRATDGGYAEDQQLPLARGERRGEQDVAVESVERHGEGRVARQRAEGVARLGTVLGLRERMAGLCGPQRGEGRPHLLWPFLGRQRRNPCHLRCSGRR